MTTCSTNICRPERLPLQARRCRPTAPSGCRRIPPDCPTGPVDAYCSTAPAVLTARLPLPARRCIPPDCPHRSSAHTIRLSPPARRWIPPDCSCHFPFFVHGASAKSPCPLRAVPTSSGGNSLPSDVTVDSRIVRSPPTRPLCNAPAPRPATSGCSRREPGLPKPHTCLRVRRLRQVPHARGAQRQPLGDRLCSQYLKTIPSIISWRRKLDVSVWTPQNGTNVSRKMSFTMGTAPFMTRPAGFPV